MRSCARSPGRSPFRSSRTARSFTSSRFANSIASEYRSGAPSPAVAARRGEDQTSALSLEYGLRPIHRRAPALRLRVRGGSGPDWRSGSCRTMEFVQGLPGRQCELRGPSGRRTLRSRRGLSRPVRSTSDRPGGVDRRRGGAVATWCDSPGGLPEGSTPTLGRTSAGHLSVASQAQAPLERVSAAQEPIGRRREERVRGESRESSRTATSSNGGRGGPGPVLAGNEDDDSIRTAVSPQPRVP